VRLVKPPYCQKCGRPIREGGLCRVCRKYGRSYTKHRAVGIYDGVLAEAVKSLKYRSRMSISRRLGRMMSTIALADAEMREAELIVPVPLHRVRERERGFNQTLLLAREISKEMGVPVVERVLVRKRYTRQQTTLSRKERRPNVAGAFNVLDSGPIEDKRILLIDDVTTTGATLEECAALLNEAGALAVYCLSAAIALT
jgi:competence protein ComFC